MEELDTLLFTEFADKYAVVLFDDHKVFEALHHNALLAVHMDHAAPGVKEMYVFSHCGIAVSVMRHLFA